MKIEQQGDAPTLSCSFLPRAWKIFTRGKTWPEFVYLKVGNDTLAKLDHPYALAEGGSCQNCLYKTRGSIRGPQNRVAMDITKPVKYLPVSVMKS